MLLAGKSGATHTASGQTPQVVFYPRLLKRRGTFSFDEQDGGVGVRRRLHLSNQGLLLFIFFFFRLQTHKRPLQSNGYATPHLHAGRPTQRRATDRKSAHQLCVLVVLHFGLIVFVLRRHVIHGVFIPRLGLGLLVLGQVLGARLRT